MHASAEDLLSRIETDGFTVLPRVFAPERVDLIVDELTTALNAPVSVGRIQSETGTLYAARNILTLWPAAADVWREPVLSDALVHILGPDFGLVRTLFFDKPPRQSWTLPWHKDLTVAVRDNQLPSIHFRRPTQKAGVPHAEAPQELLERMLTVRIHLDDVTAENGPLKVIPGSHRSGKMLPNGDVPATTILANRGDVLLMRPLLAHCSGHAHPETWRHRRILHLEFAADTALPDGYAWHEFVPYAGDTACGAFLS